MKGKVFIASLCLLFCFGAAGCSSDTTKREELPPAEQTEILQEEQPQTPEETQNPSQEETPQLPETPTVAQPEMPQTPATPTETVPPVTNTDTLLSSTVNALNVRSGAGSSYASIGTLDKSDMVMPVRKVGSWYEVYYKKTVGYVSASYVKSVDFTKASAQVEKVIDEGKKLLGMPYVFGAARYHWGNGKLNTDYTGKSYDCSSYMQYIFKVGANINLAMTSREQSVQGTYVARANIRRGDLLFFTNASRVNKTGVERIGHVALYLGDNIILHTASDHAVIEPITAQRSSYYVTARRLF